MRLAALHIDPAVELRRVRAERARRSFAYFVALIRPEYAVQWFHALLIERLEWAGTAGHDTRLGMALPPGHAKSEYALLLCAWMAARDRAAQIMYVTYSQTFAEEQLRRLKDILTSDAFVAHFGHALKPARAATIEDARNSASAVDLLGGRGWIKACGFGGGITGGRCDLIVIDDPYKSSVDASSPTIRERRWSEYGGAIKTRRRPGRPLRILMLFTRWHADDLAGRAKRLEADEWRWVELEALKTDAANDDAEVDAADPRAPGEALWPAVASADVLERERLVRPEIFACVWQGRPVPEGGRLYRRELLARHEAIPACAGTWYQSWDLRHGGRGTGTSYAVGLLVFVPAHEARAYLADVVRGRWQPDETIEVFDRMQLDPMWRKASCILIEEKADGITLLSLRGRRYPGMTGVRPTTDKITRMRAVQPLIHAGQWSLPMRAPWLVDYLTELLDAPAAANDDQTDATTQLLDHLWLSDYDDPIDAARRTAAAMLGR